MTNTFIKLISLNIEGHKHLDRVIPFFKKQKADVICLQEVFKNDLPFIEKSLQMKTVFIPLWRVRQTTDYQPGNDLFGLAILSSLDLNQSQHQYYSHQPSLVPKYTGSGTYNHVLLWVTVHKNKIPFTIANTHFTWAMPKQADQIQKKDLKKLLAILKTIPQFVLCGDFNAPRGQKTFGTLASLYQDNIPSRITTTIDPQLHKAGPLPLVVDGLFSTPHYLVKNVKVQCDLSDHCAIVSNIYQKGGS